MTMNQIIIKSFFLFITGISIIICFQPKFSPIIKNNKICGFGKKWWIFLENQEQIKNEDQMEKDVTFLILMNIK